MKEEGYTDKEIALAIKEGSVDERHKILKGIRRMQHYNEELYVVPKAFDRWRQYVYYRKAFRYWSTFCNSKSEFLKIDISKAFNRWKQYGQKSKQNLTALHYEDL